MIFFRNLDSKNLLLTQVKDNLYTLNKNVILGNCGKSNPSKRTLFYNYLSLVKALDKVSPLETIFTEYSSEPSLSQILGEAGVLLLLGVSKDTVKQVIKESAPNQWRQVEKSIDVLDGQLRLTLLNIGLAPKTFLYFHFNEGKLKNFNAKSIKEILFRTFDYWRVKKEGYVNWKAWYVSTQFLLTLLSEVYGVSIGQGTSLIKPVKIGGLYTLGNVVHVDLHNQENVIKKRVDTHHLMPIFNFQDKVLLLHTPEQSLVYGSVKKIPVTTKNIYLLDKLLDITSGTPRYITGRIKSMEFIVEEEGLSYKPTRFAVGFIENGHPHIGVLSNNKLYLIKIGKLNLIHIGNNQWVTAVLKYPSQTIFIENLNDYLLTTMCKYLMLKGKTNIQNL